MSEEDRLISELREREEQYRSIFESTSDGLLIFDLEGRIVEANPAACRLYGYAYEKLIGLSGKEIVHPDYHHLFEDFRRRVRARGRFSAQSVDLRKDGSAIKVEVHGASFSYKGEPHLLAVVRDITERVRARELLERRIEERTRELSALLEVGKPEGPFVVHGVAGVRDDWLYLDTWGGYLDFEELLACRFHDPRTGQTYEFKEGFTFVDREYHRNLPLGQITIQGGRVVDGVEFDCMSFHRTEGEAIEFIFCQALNPLPAKIKQKFEFPPFERFGRIAFPDRGETYRFDDYRFRTDGRLQPQTYYLQGWFTDPQGRIVGSVDLKAEAEAFWGRGGTENWRVQRPWWDPEGQTAWGRSFVRWRGTITLGDKIIEVEGVPGFGEFMRYTPGGEP